MRISRSSDQSLPSLPLVSMSGAGLIPGAAKRARSAAPSAPATLRLRVFLSRVTLDRQIAGGDACEQTGALALRIAQLTDPSTRRRTARELRGVVEHVDDREPGPNISAVVIEPAAVRAGREALLGLAERLESSAPVSARGVALARALLTEGVSPLYNPYCERTVNEAVFEVQDALGGPPTFGFEALAA